MFDRINSTPQLKATELYISMEARTEVGGKYVQQTIVEGGGREELQSLHVNGHPTFTHASQLGVIYYHVTRHQLQWRFLDLVININILNL